MGVGWNVVDITPFMDESCQFQVVSGREILTEPCGVSAALFVEREYYDAYNLEGFENCVDVNTRSGRG